MKTVELVLKGLDERSAQYTEKQLQSQIFSNFDFRPSETDITARVRDILKENLISLGLQKHMKNLEVSGQNQTSGFCIYDEHFGYRSKL